MTENYWQRYKQQLSADPFNNDTNELWRRTKQDLKRREKPKHHLELYSYCKTDNPFIRQIKSSPNITIDSVAEIICREKACELQYCLSLQRVAANNWRSGINLQGCLDQYNAMNLCLSEERNRIKQKELELKEKVLNIERKEEVPILVQQEEKKEEIIM